MKNWAKCHLPNIMTRSYDPLIRAILLGNPQINSVFMNDDEVKQMR